MKKSVINTGLIAVLIILLSHALFAGDENPEKNGSKDIRTTIKDLLALPTTQYKGECLRSVLETDAAGQELFATEKCPVIQKTSIEITPETETAEASKGSIKIRFQGYIINNDYYAGKLKKSFNTQAKGTIKADYVYALKELSLKNVQSAGDRFGLRPIQKRLKTFR